MDGRHVVASMPHLGIWDRHKMACQQLFTQNVVKYEKVIPIVLFIYMAPVISMVVSILITLVIVYFARKSNPRKADKQFKRWQLVSSALFSVGHGLNDAQKVMGII